jgi:hypothetical protein
LQNLFLSQKGSAPPKKLLYEDKTLEALPPNHRKPLKRLDLNFISASPSIEPKVNHSPEKRSFSGHKSFYLAFFKKRVGFGATPQGLPQGLSLLR